MVIAEAQDVPCKVYCRPVFSPAADKYGKQFHITEGFSILQPHFFTGPVIFRPGFDRTMATVVASDSLFFDLHRKWF
jgi:hypothetical protein